MVITHYQIIIIRLSGYYTTFQKVYKRLLLLYTSSYSLESWDL